MTLFSRFTGGLSQPATLLADQAAVADPVTASPSTVFVELGAASQQANISRNGVQVPIVNLDPAALTTALGHTAPVPAKVVSQSIPAGVSVAKGASIDLVLAEPSSIQISVLQDAFQPFATQTLDDVYKNVVRDNTAVQSVLARNASAATMSTQDQATLTSALGDVSLTTDPGHDISSAFHTLQAAFTFGT
jgi:hypothetical protein